MINKNRILVIAINRKTMLKWYRGKDKESQEVLIKFRGRLSMMMWISNNQFKEKCSITMYLIVESDRIRKLCLN